MPTVFITRLTSSKKGHSKISKIEANVHYIIKFTESYRQKYYVYD